MQPLESTATRREGESDLTSRQRNGARSRYKREREREGKGRDFLSVCGFRGDGRTSGAFPHSSKSFFCIVDGIIGVCSSVCSLSALSRSLPLPTVIAIVTAVLLSAEYKLQAYCALLKSNKTRKGPQGCHCWVCRYNVLWCCGSGNGAAAAAMCIITTVP